MNMLNKILGTAIIFFCCFGLKAEELDRSVKPQPGPAPSIEMGEYESFELENGLQVFVVENDRLPRVALNLVLDMGPIEEGNKKGYRSVTGDLLKTGTENRTRNEINEEIDFLGARFSTNSNGFFATSLSHNTEELLDIVADVMKNPLFEQEEFDRIINRRKSNLAAEKDDGSAIASKIRSKVFFEGHPYQESTTSETIENVSLQDCKNYYDSYFRPNIGYMSVVGDITKEEAQEMLENYFGDWESQEVEKQEFDKPEPPEQNQISIHNRAHATQTVLNIGHPVDLQPGADDAIKASLMNTLLGGGFFRLNDLLREDRAYTYGSYSRLSTDSEIGQFMAGADVRTQVTDSSAYLILEEMNRLREEPVDENELQRVKNFRTGNFAISLENPQTVARFALNIARYDLPEDYYANYLKEIEKVEVDDIQEMAQKYLKPDNAHIVAVGQANEFTEGLTELVPGPEPRYFDQEGNEIDPPRKYDIPDDLTAEDVIDNYIEAIGGRDNLELIKSFSTMTSANVQGTRIEIEEHKQNPDKFFNQVSMGGNIMNKRVLNGDRGYTMEGGVRQEMEEDQLKETRIEGQVVEEMFYGKYDVEIDLNGIEEVDGKPAYSVDVSLPSGTNKTLYFDKETHLKVRESTMMETPQGEMPITINYLEYAEVEGVKKTGFGSWLKGVFGGNREVEGLKFPVKMEQNLGPQTFEIAVDERKVNHEIDPEKFEIDLD